MYTTKIITQQRYIELTCFYLIFFFITCFLGFLGEILVYWSGHSNNLTLWETLKQLRGFLHGPWVPIYGLGCVMILVLSSVLHKKPIRFFITSVLTCSMIEYLASCILEYIFHARWWDYSVEFLNLNGRICLKLSLFFGLVGLFVIYVITPLIKKVVNEMPLNIQIIICFVLTILFILDVLISIQEPNMGAGVILTM